MRLYGSLQELTNLVIRLATGKTLKIKTDAQTAVANDIEVNIPDVGGAVSPAFLMVDTVVPQELKGKTIDFGVNTVTNASLNINKLTAPSGLGDDVVKLNPATNLVESGKIKNANIAADAAITDGKLATITTAGKVETGAVVAAAGLSGRVLSFTDAGIPSVAKIVNANVADNADISGSKLADGTVGAAKLSSLSSADLAGKVTDETGSGSLVFATSPTLTTPSIAQINTPAQSLAISGTGALTLPAGNNSAQRPGTPANGMIRYNSTDNTFEGYSNGAWAGIGGGGTTDKVTQASHGFVLGDVLYLNGSTYAKAIASAANTAEVVGVVSRVIDASTFEMTLSGEISGLAGLVAGEVYFLSASTAGLLTVTEPSVVGQVSLPVGVASSASTLYVAPKRGVVVGAANARTTISIANNTASNVVSVVDYNSLKLEGELNVTRSAGGNQRAYYTVEAAKNGAGVWQVSASYTGDDVNVGGTTALPSWDVAANNLQITMPLIPTNTFLSASLTYALNAPAVGASLPLSIDSSALNIVSEAPLSYRNRIINGDMRIDQRNSGASITQDTTVKYTLDRWWCFGSVTSKFSVQQNAGAVTPPAGFTNYLGVTSLSAYSVGASEIFQVAQRIEGFNFADLAFGSASAQAVTLSFWVRSSLTGTFGGSLRNADANRSYPFSYTISSANTWEQKSITIVGDTTGTWVTNNGIGCNVFFSLGTGATLSGTAGAWSASNLQSATGAQSVVGTNGATFYLTGVQLEVGSKASAFERRPYSMELGLAMRYYQTGRFLTTGVGGTVAYLRASSLLPVVMRAQPIFTVFDNAGTAGKVSADSTNNITAGIGGNAQHFSAGPENYVIPINSYMNGSFTASAEL